MVQENAPSNIKEFRLETDCLINSTRYLRTSREISLAHTNLQRAKMWLGKALGETGTPTPYPNSENPKNDTIEPQADHAENSLITRWQVIEDTHTARVKDFRFVCQTYVDHFKSYVANNESAGKYYDLYLQQSLLAMEEAKMWFGWELDRIRIIKENEGAENSQPQRELPL
jgi:hypothetical protein